MRWFLSPVAYAIWLALDTVDDWMFDNHYAIHIPSNVQLWISSGGFFFRVSDSVGFGLLERHIVFAKLNQVRRRKLAGMILSKLLLRE